jgi:isopentenyldiphosphate isomerase
VGQYPPIQVVDVDDNPIEGVNLFYAYDKGLIHRVVQVIIRDENGRMLLQKRGPNVASHPNTWDVSAAGVVDEGEDYQTAALRELKEEIGISGVNLKQLDKFYIEEDVDQLMGLKRFIAVFEGTVSSDVQIKIEPEEVTDTRWMSIDDIKQLAKDSPSEVAHGLVTALKYI